MKPPRSGAVIGSLPIAFAKAISASCVSWLVVSARITSTSFISGTGLKKCRPPTLSGRFVAAASSVMQSDEVFDAIRQSGPTTASTCAYAFFLISTFSTIASMTRSQSFRSA